MGTEIDYGAWRFWLEIFQILITGGLGVYVWVSNRTRVNTTRIKELETDIDDRLDKHNDRLVRVEERLNHAPTHEDLKRIHQRLDETSGAISNIAGEFKAMRGVLDVIHQFLLNHNGSAR